MHVVLAWCHIPALLVPYGHMAHALVHVEVQLLPPSTGGGCSLDNSQQDQESRKTTVYLY